jgi:anti-anti-sigma factor
VAVSEHLRVGVRHEQGVAVLHLEGELDLASAPVLQDEIDSAEVMASPKVVLELNDLQFLDSTGLRIIFSAHARAGERGQQFAVTRGSEQVQRLLAITGVGEHLRIVDSPRELLD